MKYKVTVTETVPPRNPENYGRDEPIFQQSFEELDLGALAIFLNCPRKKQTVEPTLADLQLDPALVEVVTTSAMNDMRGRFGIFSQDEPSSQGMPKTPSV